MRIALTCIDGIRQLQPLGTEPLSWEHNAMKINYRDFIETDAATSLGGAVDALNAWLASNLVDVLNVETIPATAPGAAGVRLWYITKHEGDTIEIPAWRPDLSNRTTG